MKRNSKVSRRGKAGFLGLAALLVLLLVPGLRAEDEGGGGNASQAARAVRLSNVSGQVHLYQGNQMLADQAVANTPLFEGTRIETGDDGRAEVQFEDGSVARIAPDSSLTLSVLRGLNANEPREAEILLNNGLGYFELQGESDSNHTRVRFGDTVVTAGGFTVLRLDLDKAPGELAVFSGNVHMEGGASPALDLHGGESVALNASDPNNYTISESIEPDSWDAWNSDRDQELNSAAAGRTEANNELPDSKNPAWGDLDTNGNWYNVPDQGYVWSPYEASNPDWDPYGSGYWMNSPAYGYMWISGEPWGYLPYQCGAWNYYNSFGWGWAPGMCTPWWGRGGWAVNIGYAPPRYRVPVRPPRPPHSPHPVGGPREGTARPLIVVNRHVETPPSNTMLALRDKSGPVMIAGRAVEPLRPVQSPRVPVQGFGSHPQPPSATGPVYGFQGSSRPRSTYTAPSRPSFTMPAQRPSFTPPSRPSFTMPARPSAPRPAAPPPAAPRSAPAPSHSSAAPHR